MEKFIVWNESTKEFDIESYKYVLDCNGRLLERSKNNNSSVLYFDNNLKHFFDIGLKDINENSIYADCSIVELTYKDFSTSENVVLQGYFTWDDEDLRYEIDILNHSLYICLNYRIDLVVNIKIIDTIQENKLGLIKE